MNPTSNRSRRGLTLVEMLVVLTILALTTFIAVQATDYLVDQGRYDATQQSLQNIQSAIVGPANQRAPDGSLLITGFVADMGRLPHPIYQNNVIVGDPLRELWDPSLYGPSGAQNVPPPLYSLQTVNIANSTPLPTNAFLQYAAQSTYNPTVAIATATTTLPCGWRAPYVSVPFGSVLLDGWGNPFVPLYQVPASTVAPAMPLPATGNTPAQPINVIASLGADGIQNLSVPTNAYDLDQYVPTQLSALPQPPLLSLSDRINANGNVPTIPVTVMTLNTTAVPPAPQPQPIPVGSNDAVQIVLYMPVNGVLTAVLANNPTSTTSPQQTYFSVNTSQTIAATFFNVSPGPRAIQAFQFDSATGNICKRSAISYLMVPVGGVPMQTLVLQ